MKKLTFILLLVVFIATQNKLSAQKFDAMSFNIRLEVASDGVNAWENRKKELTKMLKYYSPEIIGMQEVLPNQLKYIDAALKNYTYIGVGRDDGKQLGEFCPIFYDTTKFKLIEKNTFWLSESSELASMGWDAAYKRVCTYGLFEENDSKRRVWVFNSHFDNKGEKAREMSAKLILSKIKKLNINDDPIIFMGDLNCEPASLPIKVLSEELNYALDKSDDGLYGPDGTFNDFKNTEAVKSRIDYIFVSKIKVISYAHILSSQESHPRPTN